MEHNKQKSLDRYTLLEAAWSRRHVLLLRNEKVGVTTEVDQSIQILNAVVIVHCNKINMAQTRSPLRSKEPREIMKIRQMSFRYHRLFNCRHGQGCGRCKSVDENLTRLKSFEKFKHTFCDIKISRNPITM
jgi:hypothetical protein